MAQFGESAYISNNTRETVSQLFQAADSMFDQAVAAGIFPRIAKLYAYQPDGRSYVCFG